MIVATTRVYGPGASLIKFSYLSRPRFPSKITAYTLNLSILKLTLYLTKFATSFTVTAVLGLIYLTKLIAMLFSSFALVD
jgi:hypothetical protein